MTNTETSAPSTPWHLWVVGGLAMLFSAMGAFDYIATVARFEPYLSMFPQALLDYLYTLPVWIFAVWGVGIAAVVLGSLLLLLRRTLAALLFGVSLVGPAMSLAIPFIAPPPEGAGGDPKAATAITVVTVLLLVYALWMGKRGVLR